MGLASCPGKFCGYLRRGQVLAQLWFSGCCEVVVVAVYQVASK